MEPSSKNSKSSVSTSTFKSMISLFHGAQPQGAQRCLLGRVTSIITNAQSATSTIVYLADATITEGSHVLSIGLIIAMEKMTKSSSSSCEEPSLNSAPSASIG